MGLILAGGTSLSHSFCDTAKTSRADGCGFFLLSHRTEFKQENDAMEPLAPEEKALNKDKRVKAHGYRVGTHLHG